MWRGGGAFAVAGLQECRGVTSMVVFEGDGRILHACRCFEKYYDNVISESIQRALIFHMTKLYGSD